MLCYVLLRYVRLCYVMLCFVQFQYVMFCYPMLWSFMLCCLVLSSAMLCHVMLLRNIYRASKMIAGLCRCELVLIRTRKVYKYSISSIIYDSLLFI